MWYSNVKVVKCINLSNRVWFHPEITLSPGSAVCVYWWAVCIFCQFKGSNSTLQNGDRIALLTYHHFGRRVLEQHILGLELLLHMPDISFDAFHLLPSLGQLVLEFQQLLHLMGQQGWKISTVIKRVLKCRRTEHFHQFKLLFRSHKMLLRWREEMQCSNAGINQNQMILS